MCLSIAKSHSLLRSSPSSHNAHLHNHIPTTRHFSFWERQQLKPKINAHSQRVTANGIPAAIVMLRCIKIMKFYVCGWCVLDENTAMECDASFISTKKKKKKHSTTQIACDLWRWRQVSTEKKKIWIIVKPFHGQSGMTHSNDTRNLSLHKTKKLIIFGCFIVSALVWRHEIWHRTENPLTNGCARALGPTNKKLRNRELINRIWF